MFLETAFRRLNFHFLYFVWVLGWVYGISHAHELGPYLVILDINPIEERLGTSFVRHESPSHVGIFHPPNTINCLLV